MGRAGAGTGGGGRSGGGHSSSRSGSGHSMGNSRATSSRPNISSSSRPSMSSSRPSMSRPSMQSTRTGSKTLDTINTVANLIDLAVDTADFVQDQKERERREQNRREREQERRENEGYKRERREHERDVYKSNEDRLVNSRPLENTKVNSSSSHTGVSSNSYNLGSKSYQNTSRQSSGMGGMYMNSGSNQQNGSKVRSMSYLFAVLGIILSLLAVFISIFKSSSSDISSSYNREKLDSDIVYSTDCIVDELGWFDNTTKTAKNLKYFYEKTGVQPYIVLHEYDSSLVSNANKEDWAYTYYDNNIDNECTFLYVYFAEQNIDDVGYMYCVNGKQTGAVMDSEAQDIFWGYIDKYWYGNDSTDTVFTKAFKGTADTIMTKSKTKADVMITLLLVFGIISVIIIIFMIISAKFKRDKEKAEETERILNTPLDELVDDGSDEILNKYQ